MTSPPDSWEVEDGGAGGELVQAAFAADEMEAEVIQGLLESGGVPSLLQPTGFNGPQMLGGLVGAAAILDRAGSQRVMVHAGRIEAARALLAEAAVDGEWPESANARNWEGAEGEELSNYSHFGVYARALGWSLAILAAAFGISMLLRAL